MTTTRTRSLVCVVCDQRFATVCSAGPEHPTCSRACKEVLNQRRARRRMLASWFEGRGSRTRWPSSRAGEALTETRASVAKLLAEGRRARLTSDHGDTQ